MSIFVTVSHVRTVVRAPIRSMPTLDVIVPISEARKPTCVDDWDTETIAGVVAVADFEVTVPNRPSAGKNILFERNPFRRNLLLRRLLARKNITRAWVSEHSSISAIS